MDAERFTGFFVELAQDAWSLLASQLTPPVSSLTSQLYFPHIAAALALAALVSLRERRSSPAPSRYERLRSIGRTLWHPSARIDYVYYIVNGVVYPLLFLPWLASDEAVRSAVRDGLGSFFSFFSLSSLFGARDLDARPGRLCVVALSALIFVAFDFGRWVGHFLQHKLPVLWAFHKTHHSAQVLTPITNFRVHPVDLAVMATCTTCSVGAAAGAILYFLPGDAALFGELSLWAALALFVFDMAGALLRHSSVWLSYGPLLGKVFISPAQHQVHHSVDPRHMNKNMGFALAVWDWIAGTLYLTGEREAITYGSGDGDDAAYSSVLRLYGAPILQVWSRLRSRDSRAR